MNTAYGFKLKSWLENLKKKKNVYFNQMYLFFPSYLKDKIFGKNPSDIM